MLLLCLFLSLLILNTLELRKSETVLDSSVQENEMKFLSDKSSSILVNVYGNSGDLNNSNTKVDVVFNVGVLEQIEEMADNAVVITRDVLVEAENKAIKPAPNYSEEIENSVSEVVNNETLDGVEERQNNISSVEVEVDAVEEQKVVENKEDVSSISNENINIVSSIDNDSNVVINSEANDIVKTTRGKFTFIFDPNVVYVNMENIESRFSVFAPNDDYNKVVKALSQMAFGEARGCADTEIAATIWCVLNRYDAEYANSIFKVVSAKGQFHGYSPNHKVYDDIYEIVIDVIARWVSEKEGVENVGRVLPSDYLWFAGDGKHNHYRNAYRTSNRWDWSLPTPYIDWE